VFSWEKIFLLSGLSGMLQLLFYLLSPVSMSIIYGYYSIPVKRYTPKELDAEHLLGDQVIIKVLQKMGHLFFIPCFPIEKLYVFEKEGNTYVLPHEIEVKIKERGVIATPFYSFALPLLVAFGIVISIIAAWIEDTKRTQLMKKHFMTELPEKEYALSHLTKHHFIKLKNLEPYTDIAGIYLNILSDRGDSIQFLVSRKPPDRLEDHAYRLVNHFAKHQNEMTFVTISKKELSHALPRDFKKYNKNLRPAIPLLGNDQLYYIESIQYINGPVIDDRGGSGFQSNSQIQYQLKNIGFGATLTEVRNVSGKLDWAMGNYGFVPGGYSNDNRIRLVGDGPTRDESYAYLMIFIDSLGIEHQFSVTGKNLEVQVKRIF
jgi:hypothetical protein